MSTRARRAAQSKSTKQEENDFPVLSQFSDMSSQDISLSQDFVTSSPPRVNRRSNSSNQSNNNSNTNDNDHQNDDGGEDMQTGNNTNNNTATTTPRSQSEFQAFANSILTPLMMTEELNMNLNTHDLTVGNDGGGGGSSSRGDGNHGAIGLGGIGMGMGMDIPSSVSGDVSPLRGISMDGSIGGIGSLGPGLDQTGLLRNQQLTQSNLSAIPTSRDWHNVSGGAGLGSRGGVVSGAHFASMFASPGRGDMDMEGHDHEQQQQQHDSMGMSMGGLLPYGTDIKSSYSRNKSSGGGGGGGGHPNSYYYDTDGKSPSGSLMELVLADNVLSSGPGAGRRGRARDGASHSLLHGDDDDGGPHSQLQSNQRALADRLKHRGIAGAGAESPPQGPTFSDDDDDDISSQFPAPPSLIGSKSPKIGTGGASSRSRRAGGLSGSLGSSVGSLSGTRKDKKGPGSARKESRAVKKERERQERERSSSALNTSFGSNSSSVSSSSSSQQNDAENILFAMRGSGGSALGVGRSSHQDDWQADSVYGSAESLPSGDNDVDRQAGAYNSSNSSSGGVTVKKESSKKRNKKNSDAAGDDTSVGAGVGAGGGVFSGMDVISMIATEELESHPSPPMSGGGGKRKQQQGPQRQQQQHQHQQPGLQLVDGSDERGTLFSQVIAGSGNLRGSEEATNSGVDSQFRSRSNSNSNSMSSPASRRILSGQGGLTPQQQQGVGAPDSVVCNCKKSRCLKLYCDCFRLVKYCNSHCNCVDCANNLARDDERKQAMTLIRDRNPDAFKPKAVAVVTEEAGGAGGAGSGTGNGSGGIRTTSPGGTVSVTPSRNGRGDDIPTAGKSAFHLSGCHCKKSACLKKYCECFSINVQCSEKCRCVDCKNVSNEVRMRRLAASMESNTSNNNYGAGGNTNAGPASNTATSSSISNSSSNVSQPIPMQGSALGWGQQSQQQHHQQQYRQHQTNGSSSGNGVFPQHQQNGSYSGGFVGAPGGIRPGPVSAIGYPGGGASLPVSMPMSMPVPMSEPHPPSPMSMSMSMSNATAEEQREIGEALLALSPPRSQLKNPLQGRSGVNMSIPIPSLQFELDSSPELMRSQPPPPLPPSAGESSCPDNSVI